MGLQHKTFSYLKDGPPTMINICFNFMLHFKYFYSFTLLSDNSSWGGVEAVMSLSLKLPDSFLKGRNHILWNLGFADPPLPWSVCLNWFGTNPLKHQNHTITQTYLIQPTSVKECTLQIRGTNFLKVQLLFLNAGITLKLPWLHLLTRSSVC